MKILFHLILLLSLSLNLQAQQAPDKLMADSLYNAGKYQEAATLYESLLQQGDNAKLYYNLGNTYYRLGDMAHAILNYERAANRDPGDSDIRFNLTLARSKTVDKIADGGGFFITGWIRSWINSFDSDWWGILALVSFALCLSALVLLVCGRKLIFRKISLLVSLSTFVLCILFNIFAHIQRQQYVDKTHAIIMRTAKVKSTPAESGTELFELHEGTKVHILDNSMKQWVEIQLADGKQGWAKTDALELI